MRRIILCSAALAAVCAFAQAQEAPPKDTVRKTDGKSLPNVVVLNETTAKVEIDTNGDGKADQTLDQKEVKSIDYGGAPASYTHAMNVYKVKQWDKAAESFREAIDAQGARKWVKDYAAYYVAMSLANQADGAPAVRPAAIEAFQEVLKNPDNRWRDDARYRLGGLYLDSGDRGKAQAEFETLQKEGYRDEAKLLAAAGLADILAADGKPAEALKQFDAVIAGAKDKTLELYAAALVGKAGALTALKQYADAGTFLDGLLKSELSEDLKAKAWLALGDSRFAEASELKDEAQARNKFKAALDGYLHVVIVCFNQKDEVAKSLLYAGKCWEKLGDKARADEMYKKLRADFAATKWAEVIGAPPPAAPPPAAPDKPAEPKAEASAPDKPGDLAQSAPPRVEHLFAGVSASKSASPEIARLAVPVLIVKVERLGENEGIHVGVGDLADALGDMSDWKRWKEKCLAVWLFDESLSMKPHQRLIREKVDEFYENLNIASGAAGNRRVMTAVCGYGKNFHVILDKPTSDLSEIRRAIDRVAVDDTGTENYVAAIQGAISKFGPVAAKEGRSLILIMVTDECGDDDAPTLKSTPQGNVIVKDPIEPVIAQMVKQNASLLAFGYEAGAFNYEAEQVYDPTVKAGVSPYAWVDRGLDTSTGEMLPHDYHFRATERVGSGWGPFGPSRICRETGGVFYLLREPGARAYDYERMLKGYQPELDARADLLARTAKNSARRVIMGVIDAWVQLRKKQEGKWNYYFANNADGKKLMEATMKSNGELIALLSDAIKRLNMLMNTPFNDTPSWRRWNANRELMWAQLHKERFNLIQYELALEDLYKQRLIPPPGDIGWSIGYWRRPVLRAEPGGDLDKVQADRKAVQALYQTVIDHNPGTPWAVFAKSEMGAMYGFAVSPYSNSGGGSVITEKR